MNFDIMTDFVKIQGHGNGQQREGSGPLPGADVRHPEQVRSVTPSSGHYSVSPTSQYKDFGYFPGAKAQNQHNSQVVLNSQAHDYILQQMEYSSRLQAEAEARAQEYNDPTAQLARGAAAGVSPEAMLGSSGGYEMGVSSAPSAPGASPGSGSDGGSSVGSLLGAIASIVGAGSGVATGIAGIAESGARKNLIDMQARRETLGAMRDMVDTVLYPRLSMAKLNDAEAQAVSNVIKANMDYSWFNSYDENGTPLWKREKIEQLRGQIKQNVKLDADKLDLVMSAFKNFADGNLSFTQAEDLVKTRDSRIDENKAKARDSNASADFKEINNELYRKYGVSYNSTLPGAIGQATGRFLDDISQHLSPDKQKPETYIDLLKFIANGDKEAYDNLLRDIVPGYARAEDNIANSIKRFINVISGKEKVVLNAIDTSNPGSAIW